MIIESIAIDSVQVGKRLRAVDKDNVDALARSIRQIGLQSPITVRVLPELIGQDGRPYSDVPVLVTGLHRLEAYRSLGFNQIEAVVLAGDENDARLWEIAENLHRSELTVQERADHIVEWISLTEARVLAQSAPKPLGGRPEGGVRAAARELGIDRDEAARAKKIASITQDARSAADKAGLDSQTARLEIARAPDQLAKVHEISERRATKPAPTIKNAFESEEDWRRALFNVWNRGAADWRERALEAMDRPLFDDTRAGAA